MPNFSPSVEQTLRLAQAKANFSQAETLAHQAASERVEERHLLLAILADDQDNLTLNILRFCGVDLEALQASLASATPLLDRLGRDLTSLARAGQLDPLIGRRTELRQLTRTLLRKKKNNPVLVGPAGVGKTAIVEGVAIAPGYMATDNTEALRNDPTRPPNSGTHPRRTVGQTGRHGRCGRLFGIGGGQLCSRPNPGHRWRLAGPVSDLKIAVLQT